MATHAPTTQSALGPAFDGQLRGRCFAVPGRRVNIGSLPSDDTPQPTVSLLHGHPRSITVIPPVTPPPDAQQMTDWPGRASPPPGVMGVGADRRTSVPVRQLTAWGN